MSVLSLLFCITLSHANPNTFGDQTRTPEYLQDLDKLLQRPCVIDAASTWFFVCDDPVKKDLSMLWVTTKHAKNWPRHKGGGLKSNPYRGATVRFTRDAHGHVYYSLSDSITGKKLVSKTYVPINNIQISIDWN